MSWEVSKWLGSVGYNPNTPLLQAGYNALILTIDPNFQRDIQVDMGTPPSNSMGFLYPRIWAGYLPEQQHPSIPKVMVDKVAQIKKTSL